MDHDKIEAVLKRLDHPMVLTSMTLEEAADLIRDLRTEIDNQETKIVDLEEKVPEWMPIETAPKDGTPVLVGFPAPYHPLVGHCEAGRWGELTSDFEFDGFDTQPTLWMPLPASDNPIASASQRPADNAALIAAVPGLVEALEIAHKHLADLRGFCRSTNKPCGDPDAECPMAMGEWFTDAELADLDKIPAALASIGRAQK
jgi:hypothetical protein